MQYLTHEWLRAASTALADEPGRDDPLVIEYVITGGADHHVLWNADGITFVAGRHAEPTVTFTLDYASAAAIHRGDLSMQEAVISARAVVNGNLHDLRAADAPPSAPLEALRAATTY